MKVAIIGGTGDFGRTFARLFRKAGHEVVVTGRDKSKGQKVAKEEGVNFTTDNKNAAKQADMVIISVYIENTIEVIKEVAPHLTPGSLLMDVTSVKVEPVDAMEKYAPESVEILGTHPMFGPRVTSIEGLVFILTPVRLRKWKNFIYKFLEDLNVRVITTTAEEHDRIMSVVQVLTHYTYISVGMTLKDLDVDIQESRKFASPIYEMMLDLMARIVGQSPQLYSSIQMHNPETKRVHDVFIKNAVKIRKLVEKRDIEGFVYNMVEAAKNLGDIDAAMGRSDKAIHVLSEEVKRLGKSLGQEVAIKHIYSGNIHVGILEDVGSESVRLKSGKKTYNLKVSNIELLSNEQLLEWKKKHIKRSRRDYSLLVPEIAIEESIPEIIKEFEHEITSCEIIDIYKGKQIPEGFKSVTLRVEGVIKDFERLEGFFIAIGWELR